MNYARTEALKKMRALIFRTLKDKALHKREIIKIILEKYRKKKDIDFDVVKIKRDITVSIIRLKKENKIFNVAVAKYTRDPKDDKEQPEYKTKPKYNKAVGRKKWSDMLSPDN